MVLLNNVVGVFNLADEDRQEAAGVDRIYERLIGAALAHRDFVWIAICSHGLVEEALRRRHVALRRLQELDALTLLVDDALEVFPDALDLDICLIHALPPTGRLCFRAIFSISGKTMKRLL